MIRDFLTWWGQQLFSLLPARIVGNSATKADAVLISPVGDLGKEGAEAVALSVRRDGKVGQHGRFPCDADGLQRLSRQLAGLPADLLLDLPEGFLLDKTLVLPAAVEADLDRVLRYEMDVETPFSTDEVYWNWQVDARDRVQGKIVVTLALLPRARLGGLLALLRQYGVTPRGIVAPRSDGASVLLPLVHAGTSTVRPLWQRRRVLWGACLALALLAIALPFLRQSLALGAIDRRIAALRPAALQAQALQSRLDGTADGGDVILRERRDFADPLRVLAELTEALPDDTYLSDLLLKGHKLTVAGQSSSATRLIGILATNALFHDPSFAAPVTRLGPESGTQEVFSISADVRCEP
jgi:general secretion pathway protein L